MTTNRYGAVHLYRGTASGPTTLPVIAGTVHNSRFGHAVAGGRDVNFDGFADVVIGAPDDGGAGTFSVLRGAPSAPKRLMGDFGASGFQVGRAVAMGNVNGDSYGDVAVGAPGGEKTVSGQAVATDEGLVVVYRGTW